MAEMSHLTTAEALAIVLDTALIMTLTVGLPIHAIKTLRKIFIVIAEPHRESVRIYIGVLPEKLLCWIVLRFVDFGCFVTCVHVWWRRLGVMADRVMVGEQDVARFEVRREGVGDANAGAIVFDGQRLGLL
jgi:hypothetical protein